MFRKTRWGFALYSVYLAALGMIWLAVDGGTLSSTTGIGLAILAGAAMAVYWPRW
ncbi:hypothetical protein [Desulforamulus aquiferis]|uniref:Uncharacterized protein n=1 Tax=Desulforamulus aquiferis TaxID=1397668 RepID=A0AAW7ZA93_9FIRM|nr:hypothetical protein [Desulforamulus aquiferis]MDO7786282.1 hypothetical protein [Desulforamulus aquiferis]